MIKNSLLSLIALLIIFPSVTFAATFSDVPEGHWAYSSVEKLASAGAVEPGNNFNGNKNATYYDVAMMLGGLLDDSSIKKPEKSPFSDVPKDHPAFNAVMKMAAIGVMEGYGDGTFRGDKEINRQEFALTLATFLEKCGVDLPQNNVNFSDVPAGHWAYSAISKVVSADLMSGYGDGTFKGTNKIQKFELALIVAKLYK